MMTMTIPLFLRVLVTGGRDYMDRARVFYELDTIHDHRPIEIIIHGGATGADTWAGEWAIDRGVPLSVYPATWKIPGTNRINRAAGAIRNQRMLDGSQPTFVLAFPGGDGTADMKRRVRTAKIWMREIA